MKLWIHVVIGAITPLGVIAAKSPTDWLALMTPVAVIGALIGGLNAWKAYLDDGNRKIRANDKGEKDL